MRLQAPFLAITLGTLAACAGAGAPVQTVPAPLPVQTHPEAIARARADSARLPYTEADVDFMVGMAGHHAQAIEMARLAPERSASSSVRVLASRIINSQQDEIRLISQWLVDRLRPVPDVSGGGHHAGHQMMPGMISPERLADLRRSKGPAFDRLFLELMIQHHQGAVTMVKELFATYGAGQDEIVFRFATDVNVDQITEINRMKSILAALPPAPGAP